MVQPLVVYTPDILFHADRTLLSFPRSRCFLVPRRPRGRLEDGRHRAAAATQADRLIADGARARVFVSVLSAARC